MADQYDNLPGEVSFDYKRYNTRVTSAGDFRINGITLSIPPNNISFSSEGVSFRVETLKSALSTISKSGHGDLSMNISFIVSGPKLETGDTVPYEFNTKILPLYRVLVRYPFCFIENEMVQSVTNQATSMWAWRAMSASVGGNIPHRCIGMDMSFEYFNKDPFQPSLFFRKEWESEPANSIWREANQQNGSEWLDVLPPDGQKRFRFVSTGEVYGSTPISNITDDISECAPFQSYITSQLAGANYLTQPLSSLISLTESDMMTVQVPVSQDSTKPPPKPQPKSSSSSSSSEDGGTGNSEEPDVSWFTRSQNKTQFNKLKTIGKELGVRSRMFKFIKYTTFAISDYFGIPQDKAEPLIHNSARADGPVGSDPKTKSPGHYSSEKNAVSIDISFPGVETAKGVPVVYTGSSVHGGQILNKYSDFTSNEPCIGDAFILAALVGTKTIGGEKLNIEWGGNYPGIGEAVWKDWMHFDTRGRSTYLQFKETSSAVQKRIAKLRSFVRA